MENAEPRNPLETVKTVSADEPRRNPKLKLGENEKLNSLTVSLTFVVANPGYF